MSRPEKLAVVVGGAVALLILYRHFFGASVTASRAVSLPATKGQLLIPGTPLLASQVGAQRGVIRSTAHGGAAPIRMGGPTILPLNSINAERT